MAFVYDLRLSEKGINTNGDSKKSRLSNYKLRLYLEKLAVLGFIVRVDVKNRNAMAIMWKITSKGKDFKKIIHKYVKLGFDLDE